MEHTGDNLILDGLKSCGLKPTLVAQLRQHLREIEECIKAGYTHRQIHQWLQQVEIDVPFPSYERTIMRLLKALSQPISTGQVITARPSRGIGVDSAHPMHHFASQTETQRGTAPVATVGSGADAAIHTKKREGFDPEAGEEHSIMVAPGYHDKPEFIWDPTRRVIPARD